MVVIDIMGITKIVTLIRMVTKQLEKEGARPTLLDPLEVDAPLLAQPLHFMVSFITVLVSPCGLLNVYQLPCRRTKVRPHSGCWTRTKLSKKAKGNLMFEVTKIAQFCAGL